MGDVVEEIIAEPEDTPGIVLGLVGIFGFVHTFIRSYGWYLLLGGGGAYYLWRRIRQRQLTAQGTKPKSQKELEAWQAKEEQRLKKIQQLQEKYEKEAAERAEKQRQIEEERQKQKLAEKEKLIKDVGGNRLGNAAQSSSSNNATTKTSPSPSKSKSLRPEYNPLMGDTSSGSGRVCFRRPGGAGGG